MRKEVLRRREPQREFKQQEKAGVHYGRRERGNDFEVIFQNLLFQIKNLKELILRSFWKHFGTFKVKDKPNPPSKPDD